MMEMHADALHISLYPFLAAASKYVKESGVTLDDLITAAAFERARLRGKERVHEALKEGTVRRPVIMSTAQAEVELLSYPFARILVSCIDDERLVRRYALSEAKSAYEKLKENSSTGSSSDTDIINELSREFGIRVDFVRLPQEQEREQVQLPFVDYLRFTSNLRDKRWKLVNRRLEKGWVKLRKGEFLRIIQEAIYERIKKDLPLDVPQALCESIRSYTEDIRQELEVLRRKYDDGTFEPSSGFRVRDPSSFPPCIAAILSNLRDGVNVPHTARFAVTAFLLNIGLTEDEIIEIYKNSPDFDEERTRYQVEHIAGDKGNVRYTAPSCDTMRTYGNCINSDDVCEKIMHPLSYYKLKLKMKRKEGQEGKSTKRKTATTKG
jgi:DNA primase large subunit